MEKEVNELQVYSSQLQHEVAKAQQRTVGAERRATELEEQLRIAGVETSSESRKRSHTNN